MALYRRSAVTSGRVDLLDTCDRYRDHDDERDSSPLEKHAATFFAAQRRSGWFQPKGAYVTARKMRACGLSNYAAWTLLRKPPSSCFSRELSSDSSSADLNTCIEAPPVALAR